jgi:hypothetical protein
MKDLNSPALIHLKGWLFLLILLVSAATILVELPNWRVAVLLGLVVWASARFYYYLFYVIEHYVDADFKFSGIGAAVRYLLAAKRRDKPGG